MVKQNAINVRRLERQFQVLSERLLEDNEELTSREQAVRVPVRK